MSKRTVFQTCARSLVLALPSLALAATLSGQAASCVPPTGQKLTIYHAGSVSAAFKPLEAALTCQTGIQVIDKFGSSVGMGRQCAAATPVCDLYAPADYRDIDLFLKPTGLANFTIVFAKGRMVLAYSAKDIAEKKLAIVDPKSGPFDPPNSIPKASADWYKILTSPGVAIGGGVHMAIRLELFRIVS